MSEKLSYLRKQNGNIFSYCIENKWMNRNEFLQWAILWKFLAVQFLDLRAFHRNNMLNENQFHKNVPEWNERNCIASEIFAIEQFDIVIFGWIIRANWNCLVISLFTFHRNLWVRDWIESSLTLLNVNKLNKYTKLKLGKMMNSIFAQIFALVQFRFEKFSHLFVIVASNI